jgi:hypothetical protein
MTALSARYRIQREALPKAQQQQKPVLSNHGHRAVDDAAGQHGARLGRGVVPLRSAIVQLQKRETARDEAGIDVNDAFRGSQQNDEGSEQ